MLISFDTEACKTPDNEDFDMPDEQNMMQNHVTHTDDMNSTHCNGDNAYLKKRCVNQLVCRGGPFYHIICRNNDV